MDKANGYEENAATFINNRARGGNATGTTSVRHWAKTLTIGSAVLDVGCGPGLPLTKVLVEEGLNVYALDASPSLVQAFKQNFPHVPIACEAVEDSSFFSRQFDAILAWGLLFLLPAEIQEVAIRKMAEALQMGGKLLFTAPAQKARWEDVITLQESVSLGSEKYRELLTAVGLTVTEEFEDEGENHYYSAVKITTNLA